MLKSHMIETLTRIEYESYPNKFKVNNLKKNSKVKIKIDNKGEAYSSVGTNIDIYV